EINCPSAPTQPGADSCRYVLLSTMCRNRAQLHRNLISLPLASLYLYFAPGKAESFSSGLYLRDVGFRRNLTSKQFIGMLIEAPRVASADAKIAIGALIPAGDCHQAMAHSLVVRRTFDWIRNRRKANVWPARLHVLNGLLDIFDFFTVIPPHQKHSGLNAAGFTKVNGGPHLLYPDAALHRVENALGSTFRSNPDAKATKLGERFHYSFIQTVRARNALEWNADATTLYLGSEIEYPAMMNSE